MYTIFYPFDLFGSSQANFKPNSTSLQDLLTKSKEQVSGKDTGNVCNGVISTSLTSCEDVVYNIPFFVFQIPFMSSLICSLASNYIKSHTCSVVDRILEEQFDEMQSSYSEMLPFEINSSTSNLTDSDSSFEDYKSLFQTQNISWFNGFEYLIGFFDCLLLFFGFYAIYQAIKYHNTYLSTLNHDNYFLDRYFVRIDNRRRLANKTHLLPLRGMDRIELKHFFSFTLTEQEKAHYKMAYKFFIVILLISLFLLFLNQLLTDYLFLFMSNVFENEMTEIVYYRFDPVFRGGIIAKQLQKVFNNFKFNFDTPYSKFS